MRCPVCSSDKTEFFALKSEYEFYRCDICKVVFISKLPSQKKLDTYYSAKFSYEDGFINEDVIRKRSVHILKMLKRFSPHAQTLCDVGSGYGFFLDDAKKAGYDVYGIEPSKKLSAHTQQAYSIETFEGTVQEYTQSTHNKFDIVVCIHVVEHVVNPRKFLEQLSSLVKSGGLLYLETPNSDSHLLYAEKDRYTFLIPPEHLWLFSIKSLVSLMPRCMKPIHTLTYSYSEHFMGILKSLFKSNKSMHNNRVKAFIDIRTIKENPFREFQKRILFILFDKSIAPLLTGILNSYHKGSILELYLAKIK